MQVDDLNALKKKAANKKNGVYMFKGVAYLVFNNKLYIAKCCRVDRVYGSFVTTVGSYESGYYYAGRDHLKKILKEMFNK